MLPCALSAEIISSSGCEWLAIDQQHGLVDAAALRAMIQAADIRRIPVIVRVPWNEDGSIMRALDDGAQGVIVPMINSPKEAQRAVSAARYPPLGHRSWGPLRTVLAQPGHTPGEGNERTICFVMIETVEAVEAVDAILDVPGVDGVFVGPNDLAISHRGTTQSSPLDEEMIGAVVAACEARALIASIACAGLDDVYARRAQGFRMLGLHSDVTLIASGLARDLKAVRGDPSAGDPRRVVHG
jgi:4-hydroxy-2-oxoheptanedioate aldolase